MDPRQAELVARRFRLALDLFDFSEKALRQRLRRKHPTADAATIDDLMRAWLARRPGAEHGDGEGTIRPWPPRRP